nr:MAG TPA: hypothetical protein [Caudoviricetes sp.]
MTSPSNPLVLLLFRSAYIPALMGRDICQLLKVNIPYSYRLYKFIILMHF